MEDGLSSAIRSKLHAPDEQDALWQVVKVLGDIGSEAGTARKRVPQLPSDAHVQHLNWLLWLWPFLNHRRPGDKEGLDFAALGCRIPDTVVFVSISTAPKLMRVTKPQPQWPSIQPRSSRPPTTSRRSP